ncbi:tyrosine-type recombinase/integrase [Lacisediminihabitans profunda]|uniref:Tyrosine-type recombinase/integrase n=1 Tax=Lacisediminihabitans profunda TaxID=2594790 RepID=A0A5C8UQ26_9MICO|nr:tyrosine-type recombinase/integrase [Lacisediminihabitans profunda]
MLCTGVNAVKRFFTGGSLPASRVSAAKSNGSPSPVAVRCRRLLRVGPVRTGDYLRRATRGARSWFKTALVAAGLEPMTLHDPRHTAASLAISSGANVKAAQRMLGHASAAMTLDVYAPCNPGFWGLKAPRRAGDSNPTLSPRLQ